MKRNFQISNKNGMHEFLHELPNNVTDLTVILGYRKFQENLKNALDESSSKIRSFKNSSTKLFGIVPFYMKSKVFLKSVCNDMHPLVKPP